MIEKEEIFSIAEDLHLLPTTIEKDYILSWLLAGVNAHPVLSKILVFKGGTCLKKCFFSNYRFSEDLDFVLTDTNFLDSAFFHQAFNEVCSWVEEEANIPFLPEMAKFEQFETPRKLVALEGRLKYRGPLLHRFSFPKVKVDISSNESLVLPPEKRKILHFYSDDLLENGEITSYSFEEIFAEKIRAFADRSRPRDLFDIIHLNNQKEYPIQKSQIRSVLEKKCENSKIDYPSLSSIVEHPYYYLLSKEWENMLDHQIGTLKTVEFYLDQLPKLFDWISEEELIHVDE